MATQRTFANMLKPTPAIKKPAKVKQPSIWDNVMKAMGGKK